MLNVAKGLYEMHQKKFIHKDIKPDNILINKYGEAKLGDLGISQLIGQESSKISGLCHQNFGAPEALKN
jgi:serine/threonine protein kinase